MDCHERAAAGNDLAGSNAARRRWTDNPSKTAVIPVTSDIPVIMATAKDSEYDKVIDLDSGADDYLAKPFGMMEMISRIKAVLRRAGSHQEVILSCWSISMDKNKHIVTVGGKPVSLTLKEYELLRLPLESPGRVFTKLDKEEIIHHYSTYVSNNRTVTSLR